LVEQKKCSVTPLLAAPARFKISTLDARASPIMKASSLEVAAQNTVRIIFDGFKSPMLLDRDYIELVARGAGTKPE
jgi:hypothetical protein